MVVLTELPNEDIIRGLKGTVDFYLYMGAAVARSWPRSPGKQRAPAVEAQWLSFTLASKEWHNLSPIVQEAYNDLSVNSGLTGRDMQVRAYLSGLYRYPTP